MTLGHQQEKMARPVVLLLRAMALFGKASRVIMRLAVLRLAGSRLGFSLGGPVSDSDDEGHFAVIAGVQNAAQFFIRREEGIGFINHQSRMHLPE